MQRHTLSSEFHTQIQNLNFCFTLVSLILSDDRTINIRKFFSFKAAGQIYRRIDYCGTPTQTTQSDFGLPSYGQMYFLDPDEAVDKLLAHPLNWGIPRNLMDLLDEIMSDTNTSAKVI